MASLERHLETDDPYAEEYRACKQRRGAWLLTERGNSPARCRRKSPQ